MNDYIDMYIASGQDELYGLAVNINL